MTSRIGSNPLDDMLDTAPANDTPLSRKKEPQTKQKSQPKQKDIQSQPTAKASARMTVQISEEIVERVKNAVYWTPGLTVAQLTEEALTKALERLEKNRGEEFPKRGAQLKPGRPVK